MMQYGVYGTKGSLQGEYTDNEPGEIRVVLDEKIEEGLETTPYEAERDLSAYGHGGTVIRYMRHFQDCLDNDEEPSPPSWTARSRWRRAWRHGSQYGRATRSTCSVIFTSDQQFGALTAVAPFMPRKEKMRWCP